MVRVVDVDSHVYEPEEIWGDYLPADARAAARRAFSREGSTIVLNGERLPARPGINRLAEWRPGLSPEANGRLDPSHPPDPNPAAWDPGARVADMDALGVDEAVVMPTLFAELLPAVDDADTAVALARAYNDWVIDFAAGGDGRLYPAAVLALQDPAEAAAEAARVAGRGIRAVAVRPMFQRVAGHNPPPNPFGGDTNPVGVFVDDEVFAPVWARVAELGWWRACTPRSASPTRRGPRPGRSSSGSRPSSQSGTRSPKRSPTCRTWRPSWCRSASAV